LPSLTISATTIVLRAAIIVLGGAMPPTAAPV